MTASGTDTPRAGLVDSFFGIDGRGDCLCGPYLPLGLVRPGPDTEPQDTSGYRTGRPLVRFSQNHVSGTGGGGRYGNIGLLPYSGDFRRSLEPRTIADEDGAVGRYACTLLPDGQRVALTCTHGAALYAVAYPEGRGARLRLDLGAVVRVHEADGQRLGQTVARSVGGMVDVISAYEVIGRADLQGGWGSPHPYSVFFYLRLDRPIERHEILRHGDRHNDSYAAGDDLQVDLQLGDVEDLRIEVGLSYVSVAKARARVAGELDGRSLDDVVAANAAVWEQLFERAVVTGGSEADRRLFYSCFYRLYCMPTDRGIDDECERWQSGVRHFSEFYCLWDSVRNANSLIGLLDQELHVDMLRCLLDVAEHTGWLPDAWIASRHAHAQGGSTAGILFAEAALKGLPGIDYDAALRFMRRDAEETSPDPERCGRAGQAAYRDNGHLTDGVGNVVSRSIEYANQDHAIALLAAHLGHDDLARTYADSGRRVWALWRESHGALCPRRSDGHWVEPFDPTRPTRPDYWHCPYYYEGTAIEWTLNMRHDVAGLIERIGGAAAFEAYLDRFFDEWLYRWKEVVQHTPFLYHFIGRPDKSCRAARRILRERYRLGRDGLADSEDMGCNSAFVMATMLGIYPEMGRDWYYLIAPLFPRSTIRVGGGKTLTIHAPQAGDALTCITSVRLNGRTLDRAWLRHAELAEGGELELELATSPRPGCDRVPPGSEVPTR